jgi:hypothetical protein
MAYLINPSPSVCMSVSVPPTVTGKQLRKYSTIVAKQRLSKNVTDATNTQATIEEWLDASFSMLYVSCQGK